MENMLNLSLDEIVRRQKKPVRGGSFKKGFRQGNNPIQKKFKYTVQQRKNFAIDSTKSVWKRTVWNGAKPVSLLMSNLHENVDEDDLRQLFEQFGALQKVSIHYDRSGRSLGTAELAYGYMNEAKNALKSYNGMPLDGRPMKIELVASSTPQAGFREQREFQRPKKFVPREKKVQKKATSVEELDAEMEVYINERNVALIVASKEA